MKKTFEVLESFAIVFIFALALLFVIGAVAFSVNLACNNHITPFQIISFALCFACSVALVFFFRKDE